ncbi:alpha/beta fold hydrolase [Cellulosimicrobium arenosum]|uniref:Alpha/beta hydrolase n=1 Tax=Cellulosimicrobium arenosum TaxID=2708133 RepID=A0A927G6S6_9MICO|nr:alpha/beta hydrolase [Cellulosimicrobium arenosum]MBD8077472.1 alpha/beta hydrolase [Cellulosimicrobium arenosum]
MTTFLLVPGAGGHPVSWRLLAPVLTAHGHRPVVVDLPHDDERLGWDGLTDVALEALAAAGPDDGRPPVVVAHSMGAYVGGLVATRVPVRLLVLLNPMIPLPGESGDDWSAATGSAAARAAAGLGPFDPVGDFYHDVPADVAVQAAAADDRTPSARSFAEPWPAVAWPDVPTVVLQGRDDRLFPLAFQRAVARDRLGLDVEEMPGGHLVALSRPVELAERLEALADAAARPPT